MNKETIRIFTGSANKALAQEICDHVKVPLGDMLIRHFSDGETYCQIGENVRGKDVFFVQSTSAPVNHNLMELLLAIDAFRRSSARRVTAVIPYFGYARQDRKDKPRVPISAKLVSNLLVAAGADRILTMDLHAPQIQGFFDIPVDHLFATPVIIDYLQKLNLDNVVIVSPDAGGVERARFVSKYLKTPLAIVDKRRTKPNQAEVVNIIGDVAGMNAIIIDDMIDTAGTLCEVASVMIERGVKSVMACAAHPVFSGPAIKRLKESTLDRIVVSNTIPLKEEASESEKIEQLSVAGLLGEAVISIHEETSVSRLFVR
jgi:ribose-phosphate pyrophosphokinase